MNRYIALILVSFLNAAPLYANQAQIVEQYGNIPLAFTINSGQYDPQVKFITQGNGCTMFFTQEGTTFLLSRETESGIDSRTASLSDPASLVDIRIDSELFALAVRFLNANPAPAVTGEEPLAWKSNYFIGNDPDGWTTGVANYKKVRLQNLYDGIDLVYYGNNKSVKYDFVVQPGHDPAQICLAYDFGEDKSGCSLAVNEAGELVVSTPLGKVIERKPYCYQIVDGKEVSVDVQYQIEDSEAGQFSFVSGAYDPMHELVIDPELVYSTFLGGAYTEFGLDITVDSNGYAYLTGYTTSTDFPTSSGSFDESYNYEGVAGTNSDVFVTKMNSTGTALIYSTFIGGSKGEEANALVVDSVGNVYITGSTSSSDFPVTNGVFDENINDENNGDGFITQVSSDGSSLVYSTYIGGSNTDILEDIAIDSSGNAFVTGWTYSSDFPTSVGAYDTNYSEGNGAGNAIVAKLNSSASDLAYSTYFGNGGDEGLGIVVDSSGNAFVTGHYGTSAFVSKFNTTASGLVYNKLLGTGTGYDLFINANGSVTVTGVTTSSSFPTTSGAFDETHNGGGDTFISTLDASGNNVLYSTFIGGSGSDQGRAITKDSDGNIYVAGATWSSNFPTTFDAYDDTWPGDNYDAYLVQFDPALTTLQYSTYLGGYDSDIANAIAYDDNDNVFVIGRTVASDYPTTIGAYDTTYNGGEWDAFVFKFSFAPSPEVTLTAPNGSEDWNTLDSYNITWTSQNVSTVKLEYSLDNGSKWTTIEESVAADTGIYSWALPDTTSAQCLVRITDTEDSEVTDQSDDVFSVYLPTVTVTSPNGGEEWEVFSTEQVTWTSEFVDNVKVEYSINNGTSWETFVESVSAATGSCEVSVPDTTSTECLIRVTDTENSSLTDQSDSTFTMRWEKNIILVTPDSGDEWEVGQSCTIQWTSQGIFAVNLEYSTNSGESWTLIAADVPEQPSEYEWTVPDEPSSDCYVRVSDTSDSTFNDMNAEAFTIYQPSITVTSPNGGESWQASTSQAITWDSEWVDEAKIEYSVNSGESWYTITTKTDASTGSFAWVLPDNPSTSCKVKITDASDAEISDASDAVFTIEAAPGPPSITVISPNGGENWIAWTTEQIRWTSTNVDAVKIEYSTNSGSEWTQITAGTSAASGSYSWSLLGDDSEECMVKITSTENPSVTDQSDVTFTITLGPKEIALLSPNGDETWEAGTQQEIWWISTYPASCNIHYSLDNGDNWVFIADNLYHTTKKADIYDQWMIPWTVPDTTSTTCLIRVQDMEDDSIFDISDDVFTITSNGQTMVESEQSSFLTVACYPNPFNPATTISYQLPQPTEVTITIYNALGQQVREYPMGRMEPGIHEIVFDASHLTSGLYFYRVEAGRELETGKMLYMK